jgi:hypothetical protein
VVATLIPRKFKNEYLDALDETAGRPLLERAGHAGDVLFKSYKTLAVRAINVYEFMAEIALLLGIFGTAGYAGLSFWLVVPTASSLIALAFRDMYSYEFKTSKATAMTAMQKYWLDSSIDAACAMLFSIVGQGIALYLEPSLAVPDPILFRSSLVALPLTAMLRMMFRPMPTPDPSEKSKLPPPEIFRWCFRLGAIWYATFVITVLLGVSDIPNYYPDALRGAFAVVPVGMWLALQRDTLARRATRFTHLVSKEESSLEWFIRFIPTALKRGDPFYWTSKISEVVIFLGLAFCVEAVVRPWLQGWEGRNATVFMALTNIMGFVMCICTWRYVKAAFYAASEACHAYLKEMKEARRK